jgi:hypothetical protein
MGMNFEERKKFISVFKQLYAAQQIASKPMSAENRAAIKEKQEREENLND